MLQRWVAALDNLFEQFLLGLGLFVLRVAFGATMLLGPGLEKLLQFGEFRNKFPDPLGLGSILSLILCIFAEVLCAGLVTIGLLTRLAAVPLIINTLVAGLVVHVAGPWTKKELAFVCLVAYMAILLTGPGPFALDNLFRRQRPTQV